MFPLENGQDFVEKAPCENQKDLRGKSPLENHKVPTTKVLTVSLATTTLVVTLAAREAARVVEKRM